MTINQKIGKNSKIRLLHLAQGLGMGGAEVLLIHYIKALGIQEYEHYVYYFGIDGPVRQKIEALGVPVRMGKKMASIKQPIRFIISLLSLMRDLMKFIKSNHIQFIQSHLGHANRLAVAIGKLSEVPAFPTVHNTMAFVDRRSKWDLRVHILKMVDAVIYRVSDRVLAVSKEIKEIIHQKYTLDYSKIVVLKNGVVLEDNLFTPLNLEKEFPVSTGTFKIVAVGSLSYQKAVEVLIRATATVVKRGLNNLLVLIAGEGEERIRLEKLIRKLEIESHVKLLGIRDDVIGLMKASDIFVIPSRYEGLSIAMIEAMACGLPIIASDSPGLSTYIEQGYNGLLFPAEDHKKLAKCILQLAGDRSLVDRLSLGARESFEKEYDMRRNVKPLDTCIRKYIGVH